MKNLIGMLFLVLLFSSCASMKLKTAIPYQESDIKEVALLPVMIGEFMQPMFPLIDAAAFNGKTDKLAGDIMLLEQKEVEHMTAYVDTTIEKHFPHVNVLSYDEMHNRPGYDELKKTCANMKAMYTSDDDFPKVLMPKGEVNMFDYTDGKVVGFFKEEINYKNRAIELCSKLEVDAIAVCFSNLAVPGVTMFGISGSLVLGTQLYVINKEGEMVANGYVVSMPSSISGSDISDYRMKLDDFYPNFDKLVYDIIHSVN